METGYTVPHASTSYFLRTMGVPILFSPSYAGSELCIHPHGRQLPRGRCHGGRTKAGHGQARSHGGSHSGHTRGSVCLYLEEEGILFSGDHILEHITPNALPMLEDWPGLPERKSQMEFYHSLDRIQDLEPAVLHTGHGKSITNLGSVVDLYKTAFKNRQKKVLSMIRPKNESVFAIAADCFPILNAISGFPWKCTLPFPRCIPIFRFWKRTEKFVWPWKKNRLRVFRN